MNRINDVPKTHVDTFLVLASASFVCQLGILQECPLPLNCSLLHLVLTFGLETPLWINIKLFYSRSMYQSMPPLFEA